MLQLVKYYCEGNGTEKEDILVVLPLDEKKDEKRGKQKTENGTRSQEQKARTKEKLVRSRGSLETLLPPRSRRGDRSWHNWSLLLGTVDR